MGWRTVVRKIKLRANFGDLVAVNIFRINAEVAVHIDAPTRGATGRIAVRQGQMTALGIHDIKVQLVR